ncbi:MAG: DUF5333 domain-containing protein [Rhodobacter sp.]|nr:DUF5333 domain-containing protein [Rhodobacter sp.]
MSRLKPVTIVLALVLAMPAFALEPINKEPYINATLLQGFIADKIADNCPTLSPRNLRALNELEKLKNYALKKGYSAAEIRAFVTSKAEKARGKADAAEWLKEAGAVEGDGESFCKIGRDEIARGTLAGRLLKDKS